jgi:hypothetical protein
MKKAYKHTDLSDKKCSTPGCRNFLKRRVVETIPKADKCYTCSHPKRKVNKIMNRMKKESRNAAPATAQS